MKNAMLNKAIAAAMAMSSAVSTDMAGRLPWRQGTRMKRSRVPNSKGKRTYSFISRSSTLDGYGWFRCRQTNQVVHKKMITREEWSQKIYEERNND